MMLLTTQIELKCNKLKSQDNREYTGIFAKYVWDNVGTVVKRPHSSIVSSSILCLGYCGVLCMFSLSPCGFPLGSLVSFHFRKIMKVGILAILNWPNVWISVWICGHGVLQWTGCIHKWCIPNWCPVILEWASGDQWINKWWMNVWD